MDPRIADQVSIVDLFDQFIKASTMKNVLAIHHRILNYANLSPCEYNVFFPKLKKAIMSRARKNWKAKAIFAKIDKKAAHRCYANTKTSTTTTPLGIRRENNCDTINCTATTNISNQGVELLDSSDEDDDDDGDDDDDHDVYHENGEKSLHRQRKRQFNCNNALQHHNCLIIGSGPAGLRTAIELQLLGANRVVVVEKRSRFSRNNVLHLWPFVIDDLKSLGAKKFYGKFCAGSIDHISIRQLQLMLLKICLLIGCDFRDNCSYLYLCPTSIKMTATSSSSSNSITTQDAKNSSHNLSDSKKANGCPSDTLQNTKSNNIYNSSDNVLKCDLDSSVDDSQSSGSKKLDDFVRVSDYLESEQQEVQSALDSQSKEDSSINDDDSISTTPNKNNHCSEDKSISNKTSDQEQKHTQKQSQASNQKHDKKIPPGRLGNLCGARAHFSSDFKMQENELHSLEWDIIIGADGRRNTLSKFFPRKEFRGRLAIAITANFINRQTPIEAAVPEISGLSFIYNQDMFNALAYDTNIQLENICYYKDDTHYFVMTAKKKSLLERGVLKEDYATTQELLSDSNVNREALLEYAKDAAFWTTGLEPLEFALNHYGQEDCAMFDFTSMYAALNACKALRTTGGGLSLVSLVGDSLLEPFWPTGSGCARGFLSGFDAAWMCRQWAVNKCAAIDHHGSMSSRATNRSSRVLNVSDKSTTNSSNATSDSQLTTYDRMALSVMAERESIYRILGQTTSENLQQNYSHWTLNPHSRYPNLNRHLVTPCQVEHLISDHETSAGWRGSPVGGHGKSSLSTNKHTKSTRLVERRVKSPSGNGATGSGSNRKSPKKLKSANASPLGSQSRSSLLNSKSRSKSLTKQAYLSQSKRELELDAETYLEFEDSYNNLSNSLQYLNHNQVKVPNCDLLDDLFIPSLSGTSPSSNNLMSLEARRARDIDECLRQRRQKTKINVVREQLVEQFKGGTDATGGRRGESGTGSGSEEISRGALFQELRRLRERQVRGKENSNNEHLLPYHLRPKTDIAAPGNPLTLLNSMRRCTSFAERVKSFESKLSSFDHNSDNHPSSQSSSQATTPRTPLIDNVKNLPQFTTLQELFLGSSGRNGEVNSCETTSTSGTGLGSRDKVKKIPITKLSKDDWNVKCWEKRLAAYKDRQLHLSGSTKSLNKTKSMDHSSSSCIGIGSGGGPNNSSKPQKQVEVFQDRIKEMAEKLKAAKAAQLFGNGTSIEEKVGARRLGTVSAISATASKLQQKDSSNNLFARINGGGASAGRHTNRPLSGSWVSHLKNELTKGHQQSNGMSSKTTTKSQHGPQVGTGGRRLSMNTNNSNVLGGNRKPAMNPNLPSKPIKRLFSNNKSDRNDDDNVDDDDDDKHYDHLCVNRPTNKYLSKSNGYSSHLARTRYDSEKSIVINGPTAAHKQAYLAATNSASVFTTPTGNNSNTLTSRGSSASITSSELSTTTTNSGSNVQTTAKLSGNYYCEKSCFRCGKLVKLPDRIQIGEATLHQSCLTCAKCNITLRTNEIQFHLRAQLRDQKQQQQQQAESGSKGTDSRLGDRFVCSICEPDIRSQVNSLDQVVYSARSLLQSAGQPVADIGETQLEQQVTGAGETKPKTQPQQKLQQTRYKSREEFFNARIDYNEVYKNILDNDGELAERMINRLSKSNSSAETSVVSASVSGISSSRKSPGTRKSSCSSTESSSTRYEDAKSSNSSATGSRANRQQQVVVEEDGSETSGEEAKYKIARSETTLDGSEQVTLILPAEDSMSPVRNESVNERDTFTSRPREMIDEEEFERVLLGHQQDPTNVIDKSSLRKSSAKDDSTSNQSKKPISGKDEEDVDKYPNKHLNIDTTSTKDKLESSTSEVDDEEEDDDDDESSEEEAVESGRRDHEPDDDDRRSKKSDASSSLNSPPNTDEYEDEDDDEDDDENVDSTCGDFATSGEFDDDEEDQQERDLDYREGDHLSQEQEATPGCNSARVEGDQLIKTLASRRSQEISCQDNN